MIEQTQEGPSANVTPEAHYLNKVVKLFSQAEYYYGLQKTHEDENNQVHFFKHTIKLSMYPRLHLKFDPQRKTIDIHFDEKPHSAQDLSQQVTEGIEQLHNFLVDKYNPTDTDMIELKKDLTKQCLTLTLFRSASKLENKQKVAKSKKVAEARKRKKYKRDEKREEWIITDWEPVDLKLHEEANRQLHQDPDKIE